MKKLVPKVILPVRGPAYRERLVQVAPSAVHLLHGRMSGEGVSHPFLEGRRLAKREARKEDARQATRTGERTDEISRSREAPGAERSADGAGGWGWMVIVVAGGKTKRIHSFFCRAALSLSWAGHRIGTMRLRRDTAYTTAPINPLCRSPISLPAAFDPCHQRSGSPQLAAPQIIPRLITAHIQSLVFCSGLHQPITFSGGMCFLTLKAGGSHRDHT